MKILLASNNSHKAREIQQLLDRLEPGFIDLIIPEALLNKTIDVIEDGMTIEDNAFKKAYEFFQLTKVPCIADDTGLEIEALDRQPGVNSARFSGIHGNDEMNRRLVLDLLKNIPEEKRLARFRTVICYIDDERTAYIEGNCNGRIIEEERGANGFGYDSIFVPQGYDVTFAEMSAEKKNDLSHRGKAIINLVKFLKK